MESFVLLKEGMKAPHSNRTFRGAGTLLQAQLRAGEGVLCPMQPGTTPPEWYFTKPLWTAPGSTPKSQRFAFHSRGSWAGCAAPGLEFPLTGLQPALLRPPTQSRLEPLPCLVIYKTQVEEWAERVEISLSVFL